jgi:HEAT repeat protein
MGIPDLVEQARRDDAEAAERLVEIGEPAIPAITAAVRSRFKPQGKLPEVLKSIYLNGVVRAPVEALRSENLIVLTAAAGALAERTEPERVAALVERLQDPDETPTRRSVLAQALGDAGDSAALPALRTALAEEVDVPRPPDSVPWMILETLVALSKLGDFTEGRHAVALLTDPFPPTCANAAKALRIAAGPGMVEGLTRLVGSEIPEGRLAAVDPLFLAGTPDATQALIDAAANSADPTVRNNALVRANDVLGTTFADPEHVRDHWSGVSSSLDTQVRYRSGEPFSVPLLLRLINPGDRREAEYREELTLAVGRRFTELDETTRAGLSRDFPETGRHYRWGDLAPEEFFS